MLDRLPRSTREALDALSEALGVERAAQVSKIVAIAAAADSYGVGAAEVDAVIEAMGEERTIQPGPDGCPLVGEFLALEVGPILGISATSAIGVIGEVLSVRARFPTLWTLFLETRIEWRMAVSVARECWELSVEAAAEVDRRCAAVVPGWALSRLMWHVKKWVVEVDPVLAARREAVARVRRFVEVDTISDAHCRMSGWLAPQDAIAFNQALDRIADGLPAQPLPDELAHFDHTPEQTARFDRNRRRAAAVGVLARQAFGQDVLPTHELVVHIDADDPVFDYAGDAANSGVAVVEKWGSLLTSRLPEFLSGSKVVVRPVIDPAGLPGEDRHDPSRVLRLAVCTANPVEVFPYGSRRSSSCDLDHTTEYVEGGPPGQTAVGNLGPLGRFAHRGKTHGGFHVCQPRPGIFHWRTPLGFEYLVWRHGTIRITPTVGEVLPGVPPPVKPYSDPPPDDPAWDCAPTPVEQAWVACQAVLRLAG